jgi:hypothetical protein
MLSDLVAYKETFVYILYHTNFNFIETKDPSG